MDVVGFDEEARGRLERLVGIEALALVRVPTGASKRLDVVLTALVLPAVLPAVVEGVSKVGVALVVAAAAAMPTAGLGEAGVVDGPAAGDRKRRNSSDGVANENETRFA